MAQNIPILLVEDDEIDIELVRRMLKKANVANPLHTARDGTEALEVLRGQNGRDKLPQPCLILLDINMPRMNGFELLEKMRGDADMKRNVVFMLTTSARDEDVMAAYDLQAAGYILKKDTEALAGILHEYCRINAFPGCSDQR